jgi:uncharacterized protein (DUF1697 family)
MLTEAWRKVIASIGELCRTHFQFDKAIFARTLVEWDDLIARNPFAKPGTNAPTTVHAVLLEREPKSEDIERLQASAVKGEGIEIIGDVAYLHTPHVLVKAKWPRISTNISA